MNRQLRRLNAIGKMIDLDKFYVISVYSSYLTLQAHYSPDLVKWLLANRFVSAGYSNGFAEFKRVGVEVTLT